jgi:hypothetical protein
MTISSCSTLPPAEKVAPKPVSFADYCPPPQAFASWHDFTQTTPIAKGDTVLKTAKKFRIAEMRKNAAGQRLWMGLKRCRAQQVEVEPEPKPEPDKKKAVKEVLIGGLQ